MIGSKTISVGVVDDDASVARAMVRLLRAAGIRPTVYHSAEAFLGDANRPRMDCLLLDVQLGGMSGLDLQRRLVESKDVEPIIFITAHDEPELREQAIRAGCLAYLGKTEPGEAVLDAIRMAVRVKGQPRDVCLASNDTP
jgi:FixJ family two-component response regulator